MKYEVGSKLKLTMPALLAVSALASGCGDDEDTGDEETLTSTEGGETSSSGVTLTTTTSVDTTATSTTSPTTTTESTTDDTTTDATSSTDTGTDESPSSAGDTGEVLDCNTVLDQRECEAGDYCSWSKPGYCFINCSLIEDEATCSAQLDCLWLGDQCEFGGI